MRHLTATFAVLLTACGSSAGRTGAEGPASGAPVAPLPTIPHEKYTLDNGLEVILHEDHRLPLVAVSVWYHVGALHEREGRSGFAHLFEHMMFQGSPHVGEDQHFRILQALGGTQINGTTSFDRTNYFETVPAAGLETALWLESDRMGFLLPSLTKASLENQIDVVRNERRQSVENRPYGLMDELLTQTLFPPPHPYAGNVIGSMEDIAAATLDDVRDFFRTYYTPANATLVIAGDFDPAEAEALVERYFGPLSGRAAPTTEVPPLPTLNEEVVLPFQEPIGRLPKISMAWLAPPAFHEDTAALDMLAHVISGTRSARLDRRVSHEDLIAQSVTAYFQEHQAGSVFQIDLVVRPGRTLEEAKAAIDEVLADLRENPPTEAERLRALNTWETDRFRRLELLGGFGGRAEQLQAYNHYLGDPDRLGWDVARHRDVTTEDLARVLDTHLNERRVVILASPIRADDGTPSDATEEGDAS
jgi:predicted Zn-dependent peptidase